MSGIVIYGSGRHFSSGADLDDLLVAIGGDSSGSSDEDRRDFSLLKDNLKSFMFFEKLPVPVIAAIRGVCLGSALELALFCHGRVCGTGSVMGLPETTFGLIPGCGGIQKMRGVAGKRRALELILSGATFDADEALRWNIVDAVVPRAGVVDTAIGMIRKINASGPARG